MYNSTLKEFHHVYKVTVHDREHWNFFILKGQNSWCCFSGIGDSKTRFIVDVNNHPEDIS